MAAVNAKEWDILLVKYATGETSVTESQQARQWITASEANRRQFDTTRQLIEFSNGITVPPVDIEAAWSQFQLRTKTQAPASVRPLFRVGLWSRIAAALILLLAGSYLLFREPHTQIPDKAAQPTLVKLFSNEVNRSGVDTLPDGSVVMLHQNSSLSYPQGFPDNKRKVILEGGAFFDVAPNAQKQFVINIKDLQILVLGTSFIVKSSALQTEIDVLSGRVRVIKAKFNVELRARERIIVSDTSWFKQSDTIPTPAVPAKPPIKAPAPMKTTPPLRAKSIKTEKKQPVLEQSIDNQRQTFRNILQDFVEDHLVGSQLDVTNFVLNDEMLVINNEKQPGNIYEKYKTKYLNHSGFGLYFGPVNMSGKGIFMSRDELNANKPDQR